MTLEKFGRLLRRTFSTESTHSRLFDDPSPSRRRLLANAVAGQDATGAVEFFASILER
jgi:hypothetical protein